MSGETSAFKLQGIRVEFGAVRALDGVSLRLERGERVGVIGPSGGGKSTLLRVLNASLRPQSGTVEILGQRPWELGRSELQRLRTRLSLMPQHLGLTPNLRVVQNIATGRAGQAGFWRTMRDVFLTPKPVATEIYRLLERVGLEEKLYHRTDSLSGGQQQRVALARALWQGPLALLADEPVASLDPARARDVLALLSRLTEEEGLTLIASLHQVELAREYFTRLIGLRRGRIVFDCVATEVTDAQFQSLYDLTPEELLADV